MNERPAISKVTMAALSAIILLTAADFITSFSLAAFLLGFFAVLGFVALVLIAGVLPCGPG